MTRNRIPAVVVLTRTSRGRAGRRRETGRGGSPAPGRRCCRSSQSLDQLLNQAEQGEDRHRQHDEHQHGHVTPTFTGRRISTTCNRIGPAQGADAGLNGFLTAERRSFTEALRRVGRQRKSNPSDGASRIIAFSSTTERGSHPGRSDSRHGVPLKRSARGDSCGAVTSRG